jgi:hypothetical protein
MQWWNVTRVTTLRQHFFGKLYSKHLIAEENNKALWLALRKSMSFELRVITTLFVKSGKG